MGEIQEKEQFIGETLGKVMYDYTMCIHTTYKSYSAQKWGLGSLLCCLGATICGAGFFESLGRSEFIQALEKQAFTISDP